MKEERSRKEELHRSETAKRARIEVEDDEDIPGESLPQDLLSTLRRTLPGLPITEVHRIFHGTFSPESLNRLRQMVIQPSEDSGAVIIVDGRIKSANKGSRNEIKNASDWLEGFFNYCTIVEILRQPPLRLAVATRIFAQKVLYLSAKHQWSQVRGWAISHHSSAIQKGQLDPSNWVIDRNELWNFCNDDTRISLRTSISNNPKTGPVSAKKTEICRNWNTALCTEDPCKRLHQCTRCKGPHKSPNCAQA